MDVRETQARVVHVDPQSPENPVFCCGRPRLVFQLIYRKNSDDFTYVCAEAWRDVEGNGEREVAGGGVEARLQVSPVPRDTNRLPGAPLVLLLDLLLALEADGILQSQSPPILMRPTRSVSDTQKVGISTCRQGMSPSEKLNVPMMSSPSL